MTAFAMPAIVRGKQFWTPFRTLMASEDTGRAQGRLPGGHVMDLSDMRKAILLCPDCIRKFPAKRSEYVTKKNLPVVRGKCDGCRGYTMAGRLLVHYTMANLTT